MIGKPLGFCKVMANVPITINKMMNIMNIMNIYDYIDYIGHIDHTNEYRHM